MPRASDTIADWRRVGEQGLLVEVRTASDVARVARWVERTVPAGALRELVPGARTVFVLTQPHDRDRVLAGLMSAARSAVIDDEQTRRSGRHVVLPVRYDGPDLAAVAEVLGMRVSDVIKHHSSAEYHVGFFGFAPGQAFFDGVPEPLRVPRRPSPRTRVEAGSLAIANEYSVIYPAASPGGWNLIGSSLGPPLWDLSRTPPNLVAIGDVVVFKEA